MKTTLRLIGLMLFFGAGNSTANPSIHGWDNFTAAINSTAPSKMQELQGREFTMHLTNAAPDNQLKLIPGAAFEVIQESDSKYRVVIVSPSALIRDVNGIIIKNSVGWSLTIGGDNEFDKSLEGVASCRYSVKFRQKGGSELDLSKFDQSFDISWDVSRNGELTDIKRDGQGLSLARLSGNDDDLKIRLRISKASENLNIGSDWVDIPSCSLVAKTPTPSVANEPEPSSCISISVASTGICDLKCGAFTVTPHVKAVNTCDRAVSCIDMPWEMIHEGEVIAQNTSWVDLNSKQDTSFEVPFITAQKKLPFTVSHGTGRCTYK